MPRSRSRSIESSTCSRIWRASTVWVSSRMRSASVDLPWSMWAMIEKLRMCAWSMRGHRVRRWWWVHLAAQAARDHAPDLRALRDPLERHRGGVDGEPDREPDPDREHLRGHAAPEQAVEAAPRQVGGDAEQHRSDRDLQRDDRRAPAPEAPMQLAAQVADLGEGHHGARVPRPHHDPGDAVGLVEGD